MTSFKYNDYADGNKVEEMELSYEEFPRWYEQHIIPPQYVKIRHRGYLSHRIKTERIRGILPQLNLPTAMPRVAETVALRILINTGLDLTICQVGKKGKMELVQTLIMHSGSLVAVKDFSNQG